MYLCEQLNTTTLMQASFHTVLKPTWLVIICLGRVVEIRINHLLLCEE